MKTNRVVLLALILFSSLLTGCSSTLASAVPPTAAAPTLTPTEKPKPTPTPTRTPQAITVNATETGAPLPVPSPFDISMLFTNGSCGTGTPTWTYTFTIDGTAITQVQTNDGVALITLTGIYDPVTGAFSTSADVGTGIENYDGVIAYDGAAITVTGTYGYTPTGGTACTFSFEGTATP